MRDFYNCYAKVPDQAPSGRPLHHQGARDVPTGRNRAGVVGPGQYGIGCHTRNVVTDMRDPVPDQEARPHSLPRAVMQAAADRGLTAPQLAAECEVNVWAVYRAALMFQIQLRRVAPPSPWTILRRPCVIGHCCGCEAVVVPALSDRRPLRCSMCKARRSLAQIALADEEIIGELADAAEALREGLS
jgi:hypothetical protein